MTAKLTTPKKQARELDCYIQEAFFRGWCFGFSYCHTARRSKDAPTTAMIERYKQQKAGIKSSVRESLKRLPPTKRGKGKGGKA